ncbi:MAG TPA: hypothetical protein VMU51_22585 [Mycobacteriales bacterium]|nr:hypothetical protein [Mycobacteriales bacterium]
MIGSVELVVLLALLALVLLVALPRWVTGERFLVRWGVPRPTGEQIDAANRYLRRRRLLYPVCWLGGPALMLLVADLVGPADGLNGRRLWGLLASVLAALLLAELLATLRPARGTVRSALLVRRRLRDLVPWWAVSAHLLLIGLVTAQAGAAIAAHSWAAAVVAADAAAAAPTAGDQPAGGYLDAGYVRTALDVSGSWLVLADVALGLLAVYGVVLLAVRRRAEADPQVDPVLRTRSARVAVGVGIGLALGLVNQTNSQISALHNLASGALNPVDLPAEPGWLALAARLDGYGMVAALAIGLIAWRMVVAPPPRPVPAATA